MVKYKILKAMLLKVVSILILFFLASKNSKAQEFDETIKSTLVSVPSSPPRNGKQITYTNDGFVNTIIHYRKGGMIRFRDYFRDGGLFQDFKYKDRLEHGKYHSYNEVAEIVIKGKKKNGIPYSGQFDIWDEEILEYRILTYKRGKIINNILLMDFLTNRKP
jgi:antitoxin component YwqK of YwqJK toxin-antitoxin module